MVQSVSIVVPAFNAQDVLPICIDALLAQTTIPGTAEIVIVDDGSTDNTVAVAESRIDDARHRGFQLVVLQQPENAGPAAARNRGAFEASGEIIIFTDADCEPLPHWLGEMLSPFADPSISAVKGAYLSKQTELGARFAQAEFEERYRLLAAAETVDVVFSYSAAFRADVFRELEGFDARFPVADNEDTDLSWRLTAAGHRIVFNPQAQLYHRHVPAVATYLKKKISRGYWRMVVYRRFPDKAVKDSYTPQGLKLQVLLSLLIMASCLVSLAAPLLWGVTAVLVLLFAATTVPFAAAVVKKDPVLAVLSPLLLFGRATALGLGVAKSVPDAIWGNPLSDKKKTA